MESLGVLYQCWWLRPREHSGSECLRCFEFCAKLRVQLQLCAGRNSSRMALVAPSTMSSKTTQGILSMFPSSSRSLLFWFMMEIHGKSIELLIVRYLILASASIVFYVFVYFPNPLFASPNLGTPCPWPPPPRFFSGILRRSFPRIMFHDLSGGGESLHVRQLRPSTNWKQNRVADDFQISRHLNQEHNTTLSWWVKRRKCFIKCVSQLIQNGLQLGCV